MKNRAFTSLYLGIVVAASGNLFSCVGKSGNGVGPDYQGVPMDIPTTYKSAPPILPTTAPASRLGQQWWKLFGDPTLNELENAALGTGETEGQNQDLRAAMARVAQARATVASVQSQFYPSVTMDPTAFRSRTSPSRTGSSTTGNNFIIPLDLSYEIDIWGRVRRSVEAAQGTYQVSVVDVEVVRQTIAADVAVDYFTLRSLEDQYLILQGNIVLFQREVELAQQRLNTGIATNLDLLQAQTQRDSAIALQMDLERQRADLEHALAVLVGKAPSELAIPKLAPLASPTPTTMAAAGDVAGETLRLPVPIPPTIPAGLPADLLKRRPDVAEAEWNLLAANAQIGIATANFYPVVKLTGVAGYESIDLQHAFDWENRIWAIGPSISIPIFEGGQLTAALEQTKARYLELQANYRGTVLRAFQEVEDALTDLHLRAKTSVVLNQALASAQQNQRLSLLQYQRGMVDYLQVIVAQRTLLTAQLAASELQYQRMISSVLLCKALGGGWDPNFPTTAPAPSE